MSPAETEGKFSRPRALQQSCLIPTSSVTMKDHVRCVSAPRWSAGTTGNDQGEIDQLPMDEALFPGMFPRYQLLWVERSARLARYVRCRASTINTTSTTLAVTLLEFDLVTPRPVSETCRPTRKGQNISANSDTNVRRGRKLGQSHIRSERRPLDSWNRSVVPCL